MYNHKSCSPGSNIARSDLDDIRNVVKVLRVRRAVKQTAAKMMATGTDTSKHGLAALVN